MVRKNNNSLIKNKKLLRLVLLTLIFVVLLMVVTSVVVNKNLSGKPISTSEINVSFMIGDRIGLVAETDILNLGRVPPGNSASRKFFLYPEEYPVQVYIDFSEEISDYIKVSDNNFIMEPDVDNVTLKVTLYNTANLSYGNYSGKATIYYFSVD